MWSLEPLWGFLHNVVLIYTLGSVPLALIFKQRSPLMATILAVLGIVGATYFWRDRINEHRDTSKPKIEVADMIGEAFNFLGDVLKPLGRLFSPDGQIGTKPQPQPSNYGGALQPPVPDHVSAPITDSNSPEAIAQIQADIVGKIYWNRQNKSSCVAGKKMHIVAQRGYPIGTFLRMNLFPVETSDLMANGYTNRRKLDHGEQITVVGDQPDYVRPSGWSCLVQVNRTGEQGLVYKVDLAPGK